MPIQYTTRNNEKQCERYQVDHKFTKLNAIHQFKSHHLETKIRGKKAWFIAKIKKSPHTTEAENAALSSRRLT
jgi:hypothetical protein